MRIKCFILLLLFCGFLGAKEPNRYSVITLNNKTPFRIFYSYQWGKGEEDWRNSLKPFGTYTHWWEFKYPNQNWAPWFYLHRDGDGADKWYQLGSFYSPNTSSKNGRLYIFEDIGDFDVEIQLYERFYRE